MLDQKKLRFALDVYKKHFNETAPMEQYKWEALAWFQHHWNDNAADYSSMVIESFRQTGNLLSCRMYFPYGVLQTTAQENPDLLAQAFQTLYDPAQPLENRYRSFQSAFRTYTRACGKKNDYQDTHAASIYLTFRYPEEYFIFKSGEYEAFRSLVDFQDSPPSPLPKVWKLESNSRLCQEILSVVLNDSELIAWDDERIRKAGCTDPNHHLLVSDIVFGCTAYPSLRQELFGSASTAEDTLFMSSSQSQSATDIPLNTILYGPPGTGKTYHTVIYAVAVIEQVPLDVIEAEAAVNYSEVLRRFREYRAAERIGFVAFHQSYGYEDFIEGIRPVVSGEDDADGGDLRYRVEPGIFKRFCARAEVRSVSAPDIRHLGIREDPAIWKVSLEGSGENETRRECLADSPNGHIRIGWDAYGPNITEETNFADGGKVVLNAFINRIQVGDIVLSCYNASTIDGIGVVTGDYEWHNEYKHFKRLRRVNWIVRKKLNVLELTGGSSLTTASVYRMWNVALPDLYRLIEENLPASSTPASAAPENYVFIIDEINRGNISKIFGELITLLEPSKRIGAEEEMRISLPYSPKPFGIPENVWVLGTMNTADRSIALLDTALRRRFHFVEMMPQPELFAGISVNGLDIQRMLTRLNQKISILYDREHTIGHACFMSLRDTPTLETLAGIFRSSILPLLQEYFYDDYEKIRLILGDNRKPDPAFQFVRKLPEDPDLFGDGGSDISLAPQYEINEGAFLQIDSYRFI